jgi:hypothetical protein
MFDFTFLEYHKIIALYQQLFGKDKVLVLPMEILKENPLQFCNKIRMFSGLNELPELKVSEKPRNEGIKAYMVSYRRISNPFIRKDALNDYSLFYSRIAEKIIGFILNIAENITPDSVRKNHDRKLREEIGLIVSDRYKESNRQTGLLTNLELGNYAYDID